MSVEIQNRTERLRREAYLGSIRQIPFPENHIWPQLMPFKEVASDDVIFSYVEPLTSTLAPARAPDAEAKQFVLDDTTSFGKASVVDWALKRRYNDSDVMRSNDFERVVRQFGSTGQIPASVLAPFQDFNAKVARHDLQRRQALDNILEWLCVRSLWDGQVSYNDGEVQFSVDWQRPAAQQTIAPPTGNTWDLAAADPINDFIEHNEYMWDTHRIRLRRGFLSEKAVNALMNSDKFNAVTSGLTISVNNSATSTPIDQRYFGHTPEGALAKVSQATGIQFQIYEATYRSRTAGGGTAVNPFADERDILLLPAESDIDDVTDLGMGFAAMLTSPHTMGGGTSGFYAWEDELQKDPWGMERGAGIKAFPLVPQAKYSSTMRVLP